VTEKAPHPTGTVAPRLAAFLKARTRPLSPGVNRLLLLIAAAAFLIAAALALRDLLASQRKLSLLPILVAGLVGVPLTIVLHALEFRQSAQLVGVAPSIRSSLVTTILGGAANFLPIPGSLVVRTRELLSSGSTTTTATIAAATPAPMNLAVATGLAALARALQSGVDQLAVITFLIAVAAAGASVVLLSLLASISYRSLMSLLLTQLLLVAVSTARTLLVLIGLGSAASLAQGLFLTSTGTIAVAMGFFPAGLGIKELALGAISPAIGLPVALGIAASVIDRLSRMAVLGIAAFLVRPYPRGC